MRFEFSGNFNPPYDTFVFVVLFTANFTNTAT